MHTNTHTRAEYHTSRKRLQQRDGRYALMTGRKRRILMKVPPVYTPPSPIIF